MLANDEVWLYESVDLPSLLTREDEQYINNLPEFIIEDFDGFKVFISHYAYPDLVGIKRFEFEKILDFSTHFEFMEKLGCNLSISGHEHPEGTKVVTENRFC